MQEALLQVNQPAIHIHHRWELVTELVSISDELIYRLRMNQEQEKQKTNQFTDREVLNKHNYPVMVREITSSKYFEASKHFNEGCHGA